MEPQELLLVGPHELKFKSFKERRLKADQVRTQGIVSGISHGTELNHYRGTSPFEDKAFDPKLRLFHGGANYPPYPAFLGYDWVGRVVELGENVKNYQIGDIIHLPLPHRSTHIFLGGLKTFLGTVKPLPKELKSEDGVFLNLGGIALQAVHDAHIKVGDRVAIFGLGAIGLLIIQLARLNGALWIDAIDPIAPRRALAEKLGADRTFDPKSCDVGREIKSISPYHGVDVAIEISGTYQALQEAIRCVRKAGTVVAGGFYQGGGTALRLGEEWHHNRVNMYSSMGVWECPHRDYPAWDRERIHDVVIDLLCSGRLKTDGLITHRLPFERAPEAYELIDKHPEEVIKIVLTY